MSVTKPVPALANTPASFGIDADDIKRRRVYIGQFLSSAVTDQSVKPGDIYVSSGQDDSEPEVLWTGAYDAKKNPGALIHVINMYKTWTTTEDGSYQVYGFTDADRPAGCDKTWNFDVVIPDLDEDLPYKLSLKKSGMGAAQKLVETVVRNMINGPLYNSAFRIWSAQKEKTGVGKYYVAQVKQVEATAAHLEIAESLNDMFGPQNEQPQLTTGNSQPAI